MNKKRTRRLKLAGLETFSTSSTYVGVARRIMKIAGLKSGLVSSLPRGLLVSINLECKSLDLLHLHKAKALYSIKTIVSIMARNKFRYSKKLYPILKLIHCIPAGTTLVVLNLLFELIGGKFIEPSRTNSLIL